MTTGSQDGPAGAGERVYTIWDYWDGPREGIAHFEGRPHVYKCEFDATEDEWTDVFLLMEIDPPLLGLAEEKWSIFLRWKAQFQVGTAVRDSHPALLADRARYDHLRSEIGDRLQMDVMRSISRRARFSARPGSDQGAMLVQWFSL